MGKVDKEKARRLLREGRTYREVAKECDCAVSVLHKMFYREIGPRPKSKKARRDVGASEAGKAN